MNNLNFCVELKDGVLLQIDKRFPHAFDFNLDDPTSKKFILSAMSHPKFKLSWLPNDRIEMCKSLLINELKNQQKLNEINEQNIVETSSSDETDFFSILRKNKELTHEIKSIEMNVLSFFEETSCNIEILNIYPTIKEMFIKFNTTLPSSAPVERLFSTAIQIFTARRNRLSDEMFGKLLFLKGNNTLL